MKPQIKFAMIVLGLALVLTLSWKLLIPMLEERDQIKTSDSRRSVKTIVMIGDDYGGYAFNQMPQLKRQLVSRGLSLDFQMDGGAYADRLQKFKDKKADIIVLPVKEYVAHGKKHNYPGVIVAAIAESRGADMIVGFKDKIHTNKVQDLNDSLLKIGYIPASPNEFVLDLLIEDFDLYNLKNDQGWRVEFNSPDEVYKALERQEIDFAVLWEPLVSKATEKIPGVVKFFGSDKFRGYIIDVFVVRRDYLKKNERDVQAYFKEYFRVLNWYANHPDQQIKDLAKVTDLKSDQVRQMKKVIDWYDFNENQTLMFGISNDPNIPVDEGVVNCIWSSMDIMVRTGEVTEEPLKDPYRIINSSVLEGLQPFMTRSVGSGTKGAVAREFLPLTADEWDSLNGPGVMRSGKVGFMIGNNLLDNEGKRVVDEAVKLLMLNYGGYRVEIRGHTGSDGDEGANVKLSEEMARAVRQRLVAVHGFDPDRLRVVGKGGSEPRAMRPGENRRSYRRDLARVEFILLEDNTL